MSEELIKNVPEEWMTLLDKMPEMKEYFIEQAQIDEFFDGVPDSFFTGCYELYFKSYKDYEPFFTCFKRGKEVFENFYEAFGFNDLNDDEYEKYLQEREKSKLELKLNETKLKEIAKRYIKGINNIMASEDEEVYDFEEMSVRILEQEEFEEDYDTDGMQDLYFELEEEIEDILDDNFFPDYEDSENFLLNLSTNALPEFTGNNRFIANYILWPMAETNDMENPFRPFFELWKYDIKLYITDDEILIVF